MLNGCNMNRWTDESRSPNSCGFRNSISSLTTKRCSWKQRKGVTECEHYKILFYSSMGPTGPCLPPFFHISLHFPPSPVSLLAFFLLLYLLPELILLEPFIMYHFFESGIIISWENKTHHVWLWIQIWTFWRKDSVIFFLWLFKSS